MNDKRILLVDDAALMRMMIKDILVKNGFTVCGEGADGIEAVEKYKSLMPDLVIMDIVMPNMDGIAALKAIKKDFPQAKIVMCSAMERDEALKAGASDFISKPFQADRIISTVTKALK
jgi:two-component system chemotaxis response regulator CheY